jgi:UDP-N-acetylglucosamine:LPS N-acetylglucosamine transferase
VLPSRPLDPEELGRRLAALAGDPDALRAMSEAAAKLARPDAADRIVEACAGLLEGREED